MKLFSRIMLFGILLLLPLVARADTIPFEGGVIIYDKGKMDPETFNGRIEGVIFRLDNGEEAYADMLRVETSQQTSPPQFLIDHLEMTNFYFVEDGTTFAISRIFLQDTVISSNGQDFKALLQEGMLDQALQQVGRFEMDGLVFDDPEEGNLTVDTVVAEAYQVNIEGIADVPIQEGVLTVKDMIYVPVHNDTTGMKDYGFDRITMNISSISTVTEKPDRVNSTSRISIDMDDFGRIDLELDMGILKGSLLAIQQMDDTIHEFNDDELMLMLMSGLFLNSAELTITDEGVLPILFDALEQEQGSSRPVLIEDAMNTMALSIGPFAPQTYAAFAPAINSFLNNGGRISLVMEPYSPVPLTSFMSFMAAPDTALSVLGMELRQTNR